MARGCIAVVVSVALAGCGSSEEPTDRPTATASPTASASASTGGVEPIPSPSGATSAEELAGFSRAVGDVCSRYKPRVQEAGFRAGQRAGRQGKSDAEAQLAGALASEPVVERLLADLRAVDAPPAERAPLEAFTARIGDTYPLLRRLAAKQRQGSTDDAETAAIATRLRGIAATTRAWTARIGVPGCDPG